MIVTGQPGWKCYENVCKVQSVYIRFPGYTIRRFEATGPRQGESLRALIQELWNSTRFFSQQEVDTFFRNWFQHHEFSGTCEVAPPASLRVLRKARCPCHTWAKGSVRTSDVIKNVNNHVAESLKALFDHTLAQFLTKIRFNVFFSFYTS